MQVRKSPIRKGHARVSLVPAKIQVAYGSMRSARSSIWKDNSLFMPASTPNAINPAQLRHRALSRWDNEGGATFGGDQEGISSAATQPEVPPLTDSELVQLRIRVIALENLVISLLAKSSDRQLDLVREMAAYISPRPGFTPHRLTIRAAAEMIHLVERAGHFRSE
jgi:hypothetical protein